MDIDHARGLRLVRLVIMTGLTVILVIGLSNTDPLIAGQKDSVMHATNNSTNPVTFNGTLVLHIENGAIVPPPYCEMYRVSGGGYACLDFERGITYVHVSNSTIADFPQISSLAHFPLREGFAILPTTGYH